VDAGDVVADGVAAAAIRLDNFAGVEAREARKTWQQEAASQQC